MEHEHAIHPDMVQAARWLASTSLLGLRDLGVCLRDYDILRAALQIGKETGLAPFKVLLAVPFMNEDLVVTAVGSLVDVGKEQEIMSAIYLLRVYGIATALLARSDDVREAARRMMGVLQSAGARAADVVAGALYTAAVAGIVGEVLSAGEEEARR